jgi:PAS domain S-box-containing protein
MSSTRVALGFAVAAGYVLAARLGFQFAFVAEQVTTVWAPSGIGMAALLLWGRSLWPAVWAGAFIANAFTAAPLWTAAVVASGNTLESVAAAWLLASVAGFDSRFERLRDSVWFVLLAAGASTTVSATIGVTTLGAAGVEPWSRFAELWWHWWLGDAVGALVVAPLILTVMRHRSWRMRRIADALLLAGGAAVAAQIVFGPGFGSTTTDYPLEFVVFPFAVAAAVRVGPLGTALVVMVASAIAIWNTGMGVGPFADTPIPESFLLLQVFVGVFAGTGLVLAAAIAERITGERRRAAAHAVSDVLARSPDLPAAAPAVLPAICRNLEWQMGALWLRDVGEPRIRCHSVWTDAELDGSPFAIATRDSVFGPGVGLPGRVFATGQPAWIQNVDLDPSFTRADEAHEAGIHGAFAFPIRLGEAVLGVIECFNRDAAVPDPDLLRTMSGVGNQLGQFIERKRQESAVAGEQRRVAAIVETALDAVIGMDHHGLITDFNPAAERIFGYSRDETIGRDLANLLIPDSLRDQHRRGLRAYLATGSGPFLDRRIETVACHADGHAFPVEVAIIRVSNDEPPSFTGFVRDLTVRKEAEREREQLLLREAAARGEAEAANRAKDQFLATLSHELRTPLHAIRGWTRMLRDGGLDADGAARALEVIDRNARLQAQLIEDILDVSRIVTGGFQLTVQPVDVGTVVAAALDAVRPAAAAKGIALTVRVTGAPCVAHGDPKRLEQVVWNLLSNAVKFTDAGGTVDIEVGGDALVGIQIRVTDNGIGIDPEFLPYVFERFRQADSSASRRHGGLGLGLAIARHLVELHGGHVHAESAGLGRGASFVIELPALGAAQPGTAPVTKS